MKVPFVVMLVALAGCSQLEKLEQAQAARDRVEVFGDLTDAVDALAPTSFDAIPQSGSARFDGSANLVITPSNGSSDLNILGDATLTANFGQGTVVGDITNMRGASGTTRTNAKLFDVTGRILIGRDDSQIGEGNGLTRPNEWRADFRGNLSTEVRGDWRVDGVLKGQFRGTDPAATGTPDGVLAISGSAVSSTAIRGESTNSLTLDIAAEN